MNAAEITFFMIVTDRDVMIADYCVRSYAKIKRLGDFSFVLAIYPNFFSEENKSHYLKKWAALPYVRVVEHAWQNEHTRPRDATKLQGPFEKAFAVWDRELPKLQSAFIATVDADFEIMDARFLRPMLAALKTNPRAALISTDHTPTADVFESYSGEIKRVHERWHTWFCLYRRAALQGSVSHDCHEESLPIDTPSGARSEIWDHSGYLQQTLKKRGHLLLCLDTRWHSAWMHYTAFANNRHITRSNVAAYRRLRILRAHGIWRRAGQLPYFAQRVVNCFAKQIARLALRARFSTVTRATYAPGWSNRT